MSLKVRLGLGGLLLVGLIAMLVSVAFSPAKAANYSQARIIELSESEEINLNNLAAARSIQLRGGWEWNTAIDQLRWGQSRFNDAVIEGTFQGSWLELYTHLKGQIFEIELDGAAPVSLTAPHTDSDGYFRVLDNLTSGKHHFLLRLVDRAGGQLLVRSLRIDGNWLHTNFTRRPRIEGFGSSTMDFVGITWQISRKLDWEAVNRGIGGTTVLKEGQYRVTRDVISQHPEVLLINYGSNDWYANLSLKDFKLAYLNMLNQVGRGLPNTDIVVLGIFPRQGGDELSRPLYNQAIQEAIAASVVSTRVKYTEVTNYNYASYSSDGTHPNLAAVNKIFVPQLLPVFNKLNPQLYPDQDNF